MTDDTHTAFNDEDDDYLIDTAIVQSSAKRRRYFIYGGIALILTIVLIVVIVVATDNGSSSNHKKKLPVMIGTWGSGSVQQTALNFGYQNLTKGGFSLEAVLAGVRHCQQTCGGNVGTKNPNFDSLGQVTQHAMVIYGPTQDSGAVADLQNISDAVGLAYHVLLYSDHALIAGVDATRFAMNFNDTFNNSEIELTPKKQEAYEQWLNESCVNNFYKNVEDDERCYPYRKLPIKGVENHNDFTGCDEPAGEVIDISNSDSIAMIALDKDQRFSLATSANGLQREIAGRVSDAAVVGSGGYIDNEVGACVATGNGDILQRFSPAKGAVTYMETGSSPSKAAELALKKIQDYHCYQQVAIVCLNRKGQSGVAYYSPNGGDVPYARIDKKTKSGYVDVCFDNGKCQTEKLS